MYKYQHYLDFPLQPTNSRQNTLTSYIPEHKQLLFDLPRQLNSSPYLPNNNPNKSKLPTQSNHSISKFAFTETSTQDHKQDEEIIPVCQNFRFNQKQIIFDDQGFGQEVTEATFKPNELKRQLQKIKDNTNHLKKLLAQNLLKKQDKNAKVRSITTERCTSKTKTKYEKILEQFYCKKDNKETIRKKVSVQKVENYKLKYREDEHFAQMNKNYAQCTTSRPQIKSSKQIMQNGIRREPLIAASFEEKGQKLLRKTFSVQDFAQQTNRSNRQISVKSILDKRKQMEDKAEIQHRESKGIKRTESWLGLTFHQRQARSLEKRKQKQNIGKQQNLKKQVQNCTFKPIKTQFRLKKQQTTASSYAKRYYQKLKRV